MIEYKVVYTHTPNHIDYVAKFEELLSERLTVEAADDWQVHSVTRCKDNALLIILTRVSDPE